MTATETTTETTTQLPLPPEPRHRQTLTAQQEQQIYAQKTANPRMTQKMLASWAKDAFALRHEPSVATISAIFRCIKARQQARKWAERRQYQRKRALKVKRRIKLMKLDYALSRWQLECSRTKTPTSRQQIAQKAEELCEQLKITEHMRPFHWDWYLAQYNKQTVLGYYRSSPELYADDRTFEFEMETSDEYSPEPGEDDDSETSEEDEGEGEEEARASDDDGDEEYGEEECNLDDEMRPLYEERTPDEEEDFGDDEYYNEEEEEEERVMRKERTKSALLRVMSVKKLPRFTPRTTSMKQEPRFSTIVPSTIKMGPRFSSTVSPTTKTEPQFSTVHSSVKVESRVSIKREVTSETSRRVGGLENSQRQSNNTLAEYLVARKREADERLERLRNNQNTNSLKRAKVDDINSLLHEYLKDSEEDDDDGDGVNVLMRKHIEEAENRFFEDDNTLELKQLQEAEERVLTRMR